MDKISDFFKDIKERLSSPLFSSFIISWLIINWKVFVGLIFYKIDQLRLDGYNSYIDLITKNYSLIDYLCLPGSGAILYTFGYPFLKNWILTFDAWIKSWGSISRLKRSREGMISVTKYMKLRHGYEERIKAVEEVLGKEMVYINQTVALRDEVKKLTEEKIELSQQLQSWQFMHDVTTLDGKWNFVYTRSNKIYRIHIQHNKINYIDPPDENVTHIDIVSLTKSINGKSLTFTTLGASDDNQKRRYHFFYFELIDGLNYLRGVEDGTIPCELKKS